MNGEREKVKEENELMINKECKRHRAEDEVLRQGNGLIEGESHKWSEPDLQNDINRTEA